MSRSIGSLQYLQWDGAVFGGMSERIIVADRYLAGRYCFASFVVFDVVLLYVVMRKNVQSFVRLFCGSELPCDLES